MASEDAIDILPDIDEITDFLEVIFKTETPPTG